MVPSRVNGSGMVVDRREPQQVQTSYSIFSDELSNSPRIRLIVFCGIVRETIMGEAELIGLVYDSTDGVGPLRVSYSVEDDLGNGHLSVDRLVPSFEEDGGG